MTNIIRLRSGKKGILKPRHPWIYKSQILGAGSGVRPGDIVTVLDSGGKFAGRGYFNPRSEIAVRLLTFTDETITESFFGERIASAVGKRASLLLKMGGSTPPGVHPGLYRGTNAYRAVFSEADGLP